MNMSPQLSTFDGAIPGLLGEGDVLGVRIEGHRFASVKPNPHIDGHK